MGKRGPKPKPTAEKKRLGNPGRRPLNDQEPEPNGDPMPPDFLDAYARQVWDRLLLSMAKGVFTCCDQGLLATYCTLESQYRTASINVTEQGAIIDLKKYNRRTKQWETIAQKKNAWAQRQEKLTSLIASTGTRLGLDPAARTAIKVPDKKPAGKFGEYKVIKGGNETQR
jgi:P27 family predicted phage terminase small subunit